MDDTLIDWRVKLDGKNAMDQLAAIAGAAHATSDTISDIDKQMASGAFSQKIGWAIQASPELGKVLQELASVQKSVFGVDVAFQQAQRSAAGFDDLEEELRVINQLFKDSQISADIAQKAFAKVGRAGSERRDEGAALSDANARAEEAHWAKIDREREDSAKRLAKIAEANVLSEEAHWAQVDRDRARAAADLAKKTKDADDLRRTKIRESITELKTLAGLGVGAGIATIGMSARAGFQDTLQGQQASAYGQLLNRQVASIFAPLLEEKTKYVAQMTTWLQGLSEPQRKSIQQMTVFGTAMTAAALVVPRVTKALATLAVEGALGKRLARMTAEGGALGGVAAAAGPIGFAIAGIGAILASSEQGRASLANLATSLQPLVPAFSKLIDSLTPVLALVANGVADLVKWMSSNWPKAATNANNAIQAEFQNRGAGATGIGAGLNWAFGVRPRPQTDTSSGTLSGVPKGFEDFEAAYTRINEAATKIDLQNQQLQAQLTGNQILAQIAVNTNPAPNVALAASAARSAVTY